MACVVALLGPAETRVFWRQCDASTSEAFQGEMAHEDLTTPPHMLGAVSFVVIHAYCAMYKGSLTARINHTERLKYSRYFNEN